MLSTIGLIGLLVAFAGCGVSAVCLILGHVMEGKARKSGGSGENAELLSWGGHVGGVVSALALTVCVGVLAYAFLVGDFSIQYVLDNHSSNTTALSWLYRLSGVWAGRSGSLLFWAWLISVFNAIVAIRGMRAIRSLDCMALLVSQLVLMAFVGVLMFSEDNMPYTVTDAMYFASDGSLTTAATLLGMNTLLEHWAMAVHPPLLFVGYAGLTIPFAYAVAALICNDGSRAWVDSATRYALASWLFLGVGIGLGSVWAYSVLGWGGYWGWDAVENASLLSWLMAIALLHSFTVYRQRSAFKGWAIISACLTFAFVIVGTFISRSGLVQSVHAFEGDPVSLTLFGALIAISVAVGFIGLALRRKTFRAKDDAGDFDSMASKDAMYFMNNVIVVVFTVLLAYMTISSALPSFMPFGGQSLSTGSYNIIARPLGVLYLGIMAVCPLMAWGKTDLKKLVRQARIPGACALVAFAISMVYFVMYLSPSYDALIEAGGSIAVALEEQGPALYYKGLTVVGFAVASLLFFNSLLMLVRAFGKKSEETGKRRVSASTLGGAIAHVGMAVILAGLIGSSMYVTEKTAYMPYDSNTDTASGTFTIQDYELVFTGSSITQLDNGDVLYATDFDVFKGGQKVGHVQPSVQVVMNTQQQKLNAAVIGSPFEDLFVVYRGLSMNNDGLSMDVRVNPLISFVWIGFAVLIVGMTVSLLGKRGLKKE